MLLKTNKNTSNTYYYFNVNNFARQLSMRKLIKQILFLHCVSEEMKNLGPKITCPK